MVQDIDQSSLQVSKRLELPQLLYGRCQGYLELRSYWREHVRSLYSHVQVAHSSSQNTFTLTWLVLRWLPVGLLPAK